MPTKKSIMIVLWVFIIATSVLIAIGPDVKSQSPKEGTSSSTWFHSSKVSTLAMGQEILQVNFEGTCIAIGDTPNDLFHNISCQGMGSLYAVTGDYDQRGLCVAVRPDGDKIYFSYKHAGKLGASGKGTTVIVGGTGKFTGLTGNGEYTIMSLRPVAEGTGQSIVKWKTGYKLP
jgi:hypothetical protein